MIVNEVYILLSLAVNTKVFCGCSSVAVRAMRSANNFACSMFGSSWSLATM